MYGFYDTDSDQIMFMYSLGIGTSVGQKFRYGKQSSPCTAVSHMTARLTAPRFIRHSFTVSTTLN